MFTPSPLIGIPLDHEVSETYSNYPWYALREGYSQSIAEMGGLPIMLPYTLGSEHLYIDMLDGLLIAGGNFDIDPAFYNENKLSDKVITKQHRTEFEYKLVLKAMEKRIPILGICGGHQLLNVILGGSLIQDIPDSIASDIDHEQKTAKHLPSHPVSVDKDTLLYKIVQNDNFMVNSTHHQAIKGLGNGIKVSAYSPDGVIEAIELSDYPFCLGVEWHPEFLATEEDKKIMKAFVKYCAEKETQRLAKAIASAGVCSRRDAEKLILEGKVKVNSSLILTPAFNVGAQDIITVSGKKLHIQNKLRVWILYKPIGYITTSRDPEGRKTIFDLLPKSMPRVITIGRLDINSEGLLLLTNSGDFARQFELPSSKIERIYRARIFGEISDSDILALKKGVTVEGVRYGSIVVEREGRTSRNCWVKIKLYEGKNREIRKAFMHFKIQVNRLIRVSFGEFKLADLKQGEVREVDVSPDILNQKI